jgi:aryl-alcohol dehydrogenase-like predicted oxidoreductase
MIPTLPFGRTGQVSTRLIFGAAALSQATPQQAAQALELLQASGVNHIDVAASYGDAEIRIGPWMEAHREAFFLATKTAERTFAAARDEIRRSLERLRTDRLDLIQLHNLVRPEDWEVALGEDGALRAALEARDEGLVRFIGVTGHGTRVAGMHLRSLERFAFDSVLLPYNWAMMQSPEYAADFTRLLGLCQQRNVAVQTIKSLARRRWPEGRTPTRTTWYEPFETPQEIECAVHFALSRPGIFVNTASDLDLLPAVIRAAESFREGPSEAQMRTLGERLGVEPLFIRGYTARA